VAVSILDNAGRVVPTADNEVTFRVSGPGKVLGVGNGDPSSHEPDKADRRHAFNGHCLVIVQAGVRAGRIVLTAASPGLAPARVVISARAEATTR
jgi:beta-galactosidase